MSRVYVVQESRYTQGDGSTTSHDYTSLHAYGVVTFMLPPSRKHLADSGTDELAILSDRLAEFNPVSDYIVFSGDPVLNAMAAMTLYASTDSTVREVQVLKWNRSQGVYSPTTMPMPEDKE